MKKGHVKPKLAPTTRVVGPMQPATAATPTPSPAEPDRSAASSRAPAKSAPCSPTPAQAASTPAAPPAPAETAFQPRVYAPADIACCHQNNDLTNCGAEAGEPCHWQQPGMEGTFHAERVANAAAASQHDGNKPTREQFDQAAWDSGLF